MNNRLSGATLALAVLVVLLTGTASATIIPVAAGSLTECGPVGSANSCAMLYRFNPDGSLDILTDASVPSTDDADDTLVGVLNNSGHTVEGLFLDGGPIDIFGFDGDGGSTIVGSGPGASYFGQYDTVAGHFTGVNTFTLIDAFKGTINFPGLVNGGSAYFMLEEQLSFIDPPMPGTSGTGGNNVPEPTMLALMGLGVLALAQSRRFRLSKDHFI